MKGFYIQEEKQIEYAVYYLLLLSPHYPFLSHEYTHMMQLLTNYVVRN
jgi:hypothetical protein